MNRSPHVHGRVAFALKFERNSARAGRKMGADLYPRHASENQNQKADNESDDLCDDNRRTRVDAWWNLGRVPRRLGSERWTGPPTEPWLRRVLGTPL